MEAHVDGCIRATASFSNGLLSMLSTACKSVVPDCELVLARLILENLAVDLVARFTSLFATMAALAGLWASLPIESQN